MWMLLSSIHLQLPVHRATQRVARQHTFHRQLNHLLRCPLNHLREVSFLQSTRVTRVAIIHFVLGFVTRDLHLLRIHNDNEVTCVDVRRVLSLMFPAQATRNFGRKTTKRYAIGVDHEPIVLGCFWFGANRLHFS